MNSRILIVEDEAKLREVLCDYFSSKGEQPVEAENGRQALSLLAGREFDAVLLDIMMPGLDGLSVCRAVRKTNDVPNLFLTALSDEEDKLLGYELGADDYVTKPFFPVRPVRQDHGAHPPQPRERPPRKPPAGRRHYAGPRRAKGLCRQAGNRPTPKEFALLRCLMQNKNLVMSREQLLVKCWGYDYEGESRAVDTHIRRLREKLGEHAACIKTVIKAGYRLEG